MPQIKPKSRSAADDLEAWHRMPTRRTDAAWARMPPPKSHAAILDWRSWLLKRQDAVPSWSRSPAGRPQWDSCGAGDGAYFWCRVLEAFTGELETAVGATDVSAKVAELAWFGHPSRRRRSLRLLIIPTK